MIRFRDLSFIEWIGLLTLILVVALFSGEALAWKPDQKQHQDQGQAQEQSAHANANSSANNANNQNLNIGTDVSFQGGDTVLPDDITIRNTASGNAPSVYPSGNCYGGWSVGLGVPGFNASGGKAVLDHQCDMRETARMFAALGERELGVMLLCMTDAAQSLPDCGPTRQFIDDYKALKAQNELLFEDVTKTVERLERVCSDAVTRGFEACQQDDK